jgi:hypothetical protein
MGVTQAEIDGFEAFVRQRLQTGDSALGLEDCLRLWRKEQEHAETLVAIREGLDDLAQGRVRPADEVLRELREELRAGA